MLNVLHTIARKLYPARMLFWLLAVLCLLAFFWLLSRPEADDYLLPLVASFAWLLCMAVTAHFFHQPLPLPSAEMGFWQRFKLRFRRSLWWCLAFLLLAATASVALLSIRAVGQWV